MLVYWLSFDSQTAIMKVVITVRKTLGSHELYVKANSVAIENVKTSTYITFGMDVFLTLLRNKDIIELKFKELCLLNNEYVDYFLHLGDGWVVSLTYGNKFLDLRKYYGSMPCSTEGMKLSLLDWTSLRRHLPEIYRLRPDIASLLSSPEGSYCSACSL
jgi:hypothetical protein